MTVDADLVVVGGGTGALGRAVVERLLAEGRRLVVPALHAEGAALPEGVTVLQCDLSKGDDVERFGQQVAGLGRIGALVNCSGGFAAGAAHESPDSLILEQVELNLLGPWRLSRMAARAMIDGGAGGRIVNVVGRAAVDVTAGQAAYQVTKAALARLTQTMAIELRDHDITVNAVLPGIMDTPANRAAMPSADHSRWVPVAEVAGVIAWLLTDEAAVVSGALVPAYGRG